MFDCFMASGFTSGVVFDMLAGPIILTSILACFNWWVSFRIFVFLSRFMLIGLFLTGVSAF